MKCLSKVKKDIGVNMLLDRIRKLGLQIEDKTLTPKFEEKIQQIFSDNSFEELTSKDVEKMMKLMPDKFKTLRNELVREMEIQI